MLMVFGDRVWVAIDAASPRLWFLLVIPPLVIALLIGMFYLTIGDLRLSALALFPAGVGALWTFGLIFGLGLDIDIVTQ